MDQPVKNLSAMQETWVWSLDWEDPLEKGKATHSSILAWRIHSGLENSWTIQSMGSVICYFYHQKKFHYVFEKRVDWWCILAFSIGLSERRLWNWIWNTISGTSTENNYPWRGQHKAICKSWMVLCGAVYVCFKCGRNFTQGSHIMKHQLIHPVEKYYCPDCGKYFSNSSNFIRHQWNHWHYSSSFLWHQLTHTSVSWVRPHECPWVPRVCSEV